MKKISTLAKKGFAFALIMVLSLSLLTACGDNGGNGNGNSNGGTGTKSNENSDSVKTPGNTVTVNPGDVVFDNDVVKIVYTKTKLQDNAMMIAYQVTNKSKKRIHVRHEDIVFNGTITNAPGTAEHTVDAEYTDDNNIFMYFNAIEAKGVSKEDIKTVQAKFYVKPVGSDNVLFEGTAIFNIVLP